MSHLPDRSVISLVDFMRRGPAEDEGAPEQRCRSERCRDYEEHDDNRWPIGPDGRCAACWHSELQEVLNLATMHLDRDDTHAALMNWHRVSVALSAFELASPQCVVAMWKKIGWLP
jgi:hypothetical protein